MTDFSHFYRHFCHHHFKIEKSIAKTVCRYLKIGTHLNVFVPNCKKALCLQRWSEYLKGQGFASQRILQLNATVQHWPAQLSMGLAVICVGEGKPHKAARQRLGPRLSAARTASVFRPVPADRHPGGPRLPGQPLCRSPWAVCRLRHAPAQNPGRPG